MKALAIALVLPVAAWAETPLDRAAAGAVECLEIGDRTCIGNAARFCMEATPEGQTTLGMSACLMAERDAELLGCAHLEQQGNAAYFGMFAVRPGLQGGGIGDAILRECERRARSMGLSQVRMTVIWTRAELIAFYLRRGYAATGETAPFPYGDERFGKPRREDLYFEVYAKSLKGEL